MGAAKMGVDKNEAESFSKFQIRGGGVIVHAKTRFGRQRAFPRHIPYSFLPIPTRVPTKTIRYLIHHLLPVLIASEHLQFPLDAWRYDANLDLSSYAKIFIRQFPALSVVTSYILTTYQ